MVGIPRRQNKRHLFCQANIHELTPENVRVERHRRNGVEYEVRRCKSCQKLRWTKWYMNVGKPRRMEREDAAERSQQDRQ